MVASSSSSSVLMMMQGILLSLFVSGVIVVNGQTTQPRDGIPQIEPIMTDCGNTMDPFEVQLEVDGNPEDINVKMDLGTDDSPTVIDFTPSAADANSVITFSTDNVGFRDGCVPFNVQYRLVVTDTSGNGIDDYFVRIFLDGYLIIENSQSFTNSIDYHFKTPNSGIVYPQTCFDRPGKSMLEISTYATLTDGAEVGEAADDLTVTVSDGLPSGDTFTFTDFVQGTMNIHRRCMTKDTFVTVTVDADSDTAITVMNFGAAEFGIDETLRNSLLSSPQDPPVETGFSSVPFTHRINFAMVSEQPSNEPSSIPSALPSSAPSDGPTLVFSHEPSSLPSAVPSPSPSSAPSGIPSSGPSSSPSEEPSGMPSSDPTSSPSAEPSAVISSAPTGETANPTTQPSSAPSKSHSHEPSTAPSANASEGPTLAKSMEPSGDGTGQPTSQPSAEPTAEHSSEPTSKPSAAPTGAFSVGPTPSPSAEPTTEPSSGPTSSPSAAPTDAFSVEPTALPSAEESMYPTAPRGVCENADPRRFDCREFFRGQRNQGRLCKQRHLGERVSDLCPMKCHRWLCLCRNSNRKFKIQGRNGTFNCETPKLKQKDCRKKNVNGFRVRNLCPVRCNNEESCFDIPDPTSRPTASPTSPPTSNPTANPTVSPTFSPTANPTVSPTFSPTANPTVSPTQSPTSSPTANPTVSPTKSAIISAASVTTLVAPDQPSIQTTDDLDAALESATNAALTVTRRLLNRHLVSSGCNIQASSIEITCSLDDFTEEQIRFANFCADSSIDVSTSAVNDGSLCDVVAAVSILESDINNPNGNIQSDIGPATEAVVVIPEPVGSPSESPSGSFYPSSSPTADNRPTAGPPSDPAPTGSPSVSIYPSISPSVSVPEVLTESPSDPVPEVQTESPSDPVPDVPIGLARRLRLQTMVAPNLPSIQTTDDLNAALESASNAALTVTRRLLNRHLVSSGCDVQASSIVITCPTDHFTEDQIRNANFCADSSIVVSTPNVNDILLCNVGAAVSIIYSDIIDPNGNIQSSVGPATQAEIYPVPEDDAPAPTGSPSVSPSGSFYPSSSPTADNRPSGSFYPSSSPTADNRPTAGPPSDPVQTESNPPSDPVPEVQIESNPPSDLVPEVLPEVLTLSKLEVISNDPDLSMTSELIQSHAGVRAFLTTFNGTFFAPTNVAWEVLREGEFECLSTVSRGGVELFLLIFYLSSPTVHTDTENDINVQSLDLTDENLGQYVVSQSSIEGVADDDLGNVIYVNELYKPSGFNAGLESKCSGLTLTPGA